MKKMKLFTVFVFLLALALPGVGFLFLSKKDVEKPPAIKWKDASHSLRTLDAHFAENFWGRSTLFHGYSRAKHSLGLSPLPDKLVLGTEGWMFLGNSFNNGLYRSVGLKETRPLEMEKLDSAAAHRSRWLAQKDTPYHLFIAPSKASVYPKKLPQALARYAAGRRTDRLERFFASSQRVQVLHLKEHKAEGLLYFRYDSHWNALGGWFAFEEIMQELNLRTVKKLPDYHLKKVRRSKGDLLQLTDLSLGLSEMDYPFTLQPENKSWFRPLRYPREGDYLTTENPDAPYPQTLLVLTDSFGAALQPYFSDHFKKVHFVSTYHLPKELVKKLKPDLVVQVVVERELPAFFLER